MSKENISYELNDVINHGIPKNLKKSIDIIDDEWLTISIDDNIHMSIEIKDEYVEINIEELSRTVSFYVTDTYNMCKYLMTLEEKYNAYDKFLNDNEKALFDKGFNIMRYDNNLNTFIKFGSKTLCIRPDFNHNVLDEVSLDVICGAGIPYKMNTNSTTSYFIEVLEFFLR